MCIRRRKAMLLGSRAPPVRKADNITAICEPIAQTMRDPQHLCRSPQGQFYFTCYCRSCWYPETEIITFTGPIWADSTSTCRWNRVSEKGEAMDNIHSCDSRKVMCRLETRWGGQSLPAALGPGVYSASNRNEYQRHKRCFWGVERRPVRRTDNLTAICEPPVYTMWDP
jgi:hypothetical protein